MFLANCRTLSVDNCFKFDAELHDIFSWCHALARAIFQLYYGQTVHGIIYLRNARVHRTFQLVRKNVCIRQGFLFLTNKTLG